MPAASRLRKRRASRTWRCCGWCFRRPACAFTMSQVSADWASAAVFLLAVVVGASAIGWNGVFVAEVARIAPAGDIAQATGATLGMTYFGVVVGPFIFWAIVTATASYA